jgi:hypothetical protein
MHPPGAPLKPIPPAVRWAGRAVGWILAAGFVASRIPNDTPSTLMAGNWMLTGFTVAVALETHRWLPTQNTVAAAGLISLAGWLESVVQGADWRPPPGVQLLSGFSHVLASRGLVRLVLGPWRGRPGYGLGVLAGTVLVSGLSVGLTRIAWGGSTGPGGLLLQAAGLAFGVLAASVWLLVKKPVPDTPNPRPALLWLVLGCGQAWLLFRNGHRAGAGCAIALVLFGASASWVSWRRVRVAVQ